MRFKRASLRPNRNAVLKATIRATRLMLIMGVVLFVMLAILPTTQPSGAVNSNSPTRFYPSTGHSLGGAFLEFYDRYGGLPKFGYPISAPLNENGLTVQYFERQRFEYHREFAGSINEVQLTRLGVDLAPPGATRDYSSPFDPTQQAAYFRETRHSLKAPFLDYWKANGGLRLFGYPLTEAFRQNGLLVQYFERARMEHHPELGQNGINVQLGLLGKEYINTHPDVAARVSGSATSATSTPKQNASTGSLSAKETRMLEFINSARNERGLRTLAPDKDLNGIALARSKDMIEHGYFAHTAPDGTTLFTMLQNANIDYRYAGEIIANNNYDDRETAQIAFDGFMNSVQHRDILLNDRYALIGVGEATDAKGFHFFTVVFLLK